MASQESGGQGEMSKRKQKVKRIQKTDIKINVNLKISKKQLNIRFGEKLTKQN